MVIPDFRSTTRSAAITASRSSIQKTITDFISIYRCKRKSKRVSRYAHAEGLQLLKKLLDPVVITFRAGKLVDQFLVGDTLKISGPDALS